MIHARGVSFLRRDYGVSSNYGTRGWSEMHATRARSIVIRGIVAGVVKT